MTKARDLASASPAPSTVSATEIGYLDGVTSAIQTQIDSKSATSHNHDTAYLNQSVIDAKGDLLAGTGNDAYARLAVGSNDQVLTADSSTATGLKWATPSAGGMTLLSTTTLSGATTTISGISGAYTHLYAYIYGVTNATADGHLRIRPNGSGTITTTWMPDLAVQPALIQNNPIYATLYSSGNPMNWLRTSANNGIAFYIHNYANTSNWKPILLTGTLTGTSNTLIVALSGGISTTSAITSLEFQNSGGNFSTGTVLLYGVK